MTSYASTITGIDIDRVIEISSLFRLALFVVKGSPISFGTVCSEGATYFSFGFTCSEGVPDLERLHGERVSYCSCMYLVLVLTLILKLEVTSRNTADGDRSSCTMNISNL